MQKFFVALLALLVFAALCAHAAGTVDWGACRDDIKKFGCQNNENDYGIYRCLTKHDAGLSKECYAMTTGYERAMSGQ